jgi:hypothetical protein
MPGKYNLPEETQNMPNTQDKNNPVEEINSYISQLPAQSVKGIMTPAESLDEKKTRDRNERLTSLLKLSGLRLSTLSYLGAAKEYIDQLDEADKSIGPALKVVIALTAVQDISNIHSDFELLRSEIRALYKASGTEVPIDILSSTITELATLVTAALKKNTKELAPKANE